MDPSRSDRSSPLRIIVKLPNPFSNSQKLIQPNNKQSPTMSSTDDATTKSSYVVFKRVERPHASQTLTSYRFCGVHTVTILVGEDSTPFFIHRDQLCESSSFFRAAFEGAFLEGSETRMSLPEEEETTFDLFIQWLYRQSYEISSQKHNDKGQRFMEPVKLYVLADKYDVTDLKSHVITKLFALRNEEWVPGLATMAYAYEHTPQNSRLRKLMADWWACRVELPWFRLEVTQGWLKEHPEVASAVISSFAHIMSRRSQKSLFVGVDTVEEYEDTQ